MRRIGGSSAGRLASAVTSVAARRGAGGLVAAGRRDRVVVACVVRGARGGRGSGVARGNWVYVRVGIEVTT